MAAGERLKTEKSGVIYSFSLKGGDDASSFFLLVHQDAGVGPGDGWVSAGLSMGAWNSLAAHSGQTQEAKGHTQNLQSYCAAQSDASAMPLVSNKQLPIECKEGQHYNSHTPLSNILLLVKCTWVHKQGHPRRDN